MCFSPFLKKYMLSSAYCVMVSNCVAAIGVCVFLCAASAAHFLFYRDNKKDMNVMDWTEKEKVQMFDKIAEKYFNKNFGTFSTEYCLPIHYSKSLF